MTIVDNNVVITGWFLKDIYEVPVQVFIYQEYQILQLI